MTPEDIDRRSTRFFSKRMLLAIIIVLVAGFTFGLWFFFISDSNNAIENNDNFLPPDCYLLNGKQIYPKP
jgi:hypothetical protein